MSGFPFVTTIEFAASDVMVEWVSEDAFVNEVAGTIWGFADEDDEEETAFGSVKLLKVARTVACNRGFSLHEICDGHSEFLKSLYEAFFSRDDETKEELDISEGLVDVLVIDECKIEPEFRTSAIITNVIQATMDFLGPGDLIVAHLLALDLDDAEWRELGFVHVGGSQFVFRDTARVNPYEIDGTGEDDLRAAD